MRLQLTSTSLALRPHRIPVFALIAVGALLGSARADDGVVVRGNYWRDRNTRVLAPEIAFSKELPSGTIIGGGYLLDAITSASAAAGVLSDQPFTELRNQIGANIAQRLGPATLGVNYRYSTEGDYWAHTAGAIASLDLFQRNTTLAASYDFGYAEAAKRISPTGYVPIGHLRSHFLILSVAQVLSRWAVGDLSLELSRLGDHNDPQSFQSNPYRQVKVSGTPTVEVEPLERNRLAANGGLRMAVPVNAGIVRAITFYVKFRYYTDDWGIQAVSPELRSYLQLGPVELRVTGRYYYQTAADFYPRDKSGNPLIEAEYATTGVKAKWCANLCYTGDAKLSQFTSVFIEGRIQFPLRFLSFKSMPLGLWLGEGLMAISYGHYINDRFAHFQYGDADVAGLELSFPL